MVCEMHHPKRCKFFDMNKKCKFENCAYDHSKDYVSLKTVPMITVKICCSAQ